MLLNNGDVMNPTPLKRTSRFDDDEISTDTNGSFLGDIHVLTTLLSAASPLNVYSSQSHDDDFGIESDSSFVGYIDGVHLFRENMSKPPGDGGEESAALQVDCVEEYDYTVATSQSTEGSSNPSVGAKCVDGTDRGLKKGKKKSFKGIVSSIRRTLCCTSIKQKE